MKKLVAIIIILLFFSCQKTKEKFNQEEIMPMNQIASGKEYDSLYISATEKGNCDAFFELYIDAMEYADKSPILDLSKKTIKTNPDCTDAQKAYFDSLCRKYNIRDDFELSGRDIRKMNNQDYHEAIKCLKYLVDNKVITKSEFDSIIK